MFGICQSLCKASVHFFIFIQKCMVFQRKSADFAVLYAKNCRMLDKYGGG